MSFEQYIKESLSSKDKKIVYLKPYKRKKKFIILFKEYRQIVQEDRLNYKGLVYA